jgi:electron transfer flavoprotein alpha subunit
LPEENFEMAGIWVFAETFEQTLELLNVGMNLAKDLGVELVSFAQSDELAGKCISHGADEVLLLHPLAEDQPIESYVPVLAQAAAEGDPDIFLIGASQRGKEIGARVAERLNTGLCSNCIGFELDRETKLLQMERLLFGGLAVQKVICTTRPQMATISPRTFDPAPLLEGREGKIRQLPAAPSSAVTVIGRTARARETVDITESKIVVSVGRGFEKEEDIQLARDLADVLGGQVGCSRPIAEELRWLPEDVYLGISGKKIKPDLYIGIGVSGQIQHVTGIRDSKVIFAINRDENAPIFEAADYGIVGDLYKVVPVLIEELKKALKKD